MRKFKVGDRVLGTCEPGYPYFVTYKGRSGVVVDLAPSGEMWVHMDHESTRSADDRGYVVKEEYFAPFESELERLINQANEGLLALETLSERYPNEIVWFRSGQSGWLLKGGKNNLPRVKAR